MTCPNCGAKQDGSSQTCVQCGWELDALPAGTLLADRYEIQELLGKGGLGRVYRARDRMLDEPVALKVMLPEAARSADLAKRFLYEIKLARKVRHRNVCPIHEYGEEGPLRFVAMELVDGVDLARTLHEKGPLPPREAFEVAIQVSKGLEAIHEAGVIHRDLKTANIMRDRQGVVRLLDFGIAKRSTPSGTLALTAEHKVVGTPEYMSPECIRGEEIDTRSDLYALGIVIFELFTGVVPFRGRSALDTLLKQVNDPPPLEGESAARLPKSLVPVLRKALAKDRRARYGSAQELLEALRMARATAYPDAVVTPPPQPTLEGPPEPPPVQKTTVLPKPALSRSPQAEAARRAARDAAAAAALDSDRTFVELRPFRGNAGGVAPAPVASAPAPGQPTARAPWPAQLTVRGRRWAVGAAALIAAVVLARVWMAGSAAPSASAPTPADLASPAPTPEPRAATPPPIASPPSSLSRSPVPEPSASPTGATFIAAPTPWPTLPAEPLPTSAPIEAPPALEPPAPSEVAPSPAAKRGGRRSVRAPIPPTPPPTPQPTPTPAGVLALDVRPWAEVEVDGTGVGKTPLEGLTLEPGVHELRLVHPDYRPLRRVVSVEAGGANRLDIDLQWEGLRQVKGSGEGAYRIPMDEGPSDPYFERGARQLAAGDTREAVLTLEPVVKRLIGRGGHRKELARAEFYLAVAYLELGREGDAREAFLSALGHDGSLKPSPSAFPAKIITFFDHVRGSTKKKP